MARRILVAAGLLAVGAVTLLALEGGEVVTVRTRNAAGGPRDTRAWIADNPAGHERIPDREGA